jgi:hypothetical protein
MENLLGKILIDKDGAECTIIDCTSNSILVRIEAKTKDGITSNNWFADDKKTWERFTIKPQQ